MKQSIVDPDIFSSLPITTAGHSFISRRLYVIKTLNYVSGLPAGARLPLNPTQEPAVLRWSSIGRDNVII